MSILRLICFGGFNSNLGSGLRPVGLFTNVRLFWAGMNTFWGRGLLCGGGGRFEGRFIVCIACWWLGCGLISVGKCAFLKNPPSVCSLVSVKQYCHLLSTNIVSSSQHKNIASNRNYLTNYISSTIFFFFWFMLIRFCCYWLFCWNNDILSAFLCLNGWNFFVSWLIVWNWRRISHQAPVLS